MQDVLVGLIVLACAAYAVWVLLPRNAQRAGAGWLSRWPWPAPLARRLRKASQASSGCGCNGCDRGTAASQTPKATPLADSPQPLRFHPRRTRH